MAECLISAENISKKYVEKVLFSQSSFGIQNGDKIGLMGINGSGKSTLLKILCDLEKPDSGQIITKNNISIDYLTQMPNLEKNNTIIEQIYSSKHQHFGLLKQYKRISDSLTHEYTESLYQQQLELQQKIERENAWDIDFKAKSMLTILGFSDLNISISTLSGGQLRRIDLARVLLDNPDILLLDEPTNHLDTDTIEWLQEYLINYKGTIIFVTHDRYFLDSVSNKILEIDNGNLQFYPGNYSEYLQRKAQEDIDAKRKETRRQTQLKKELKWLNRGAKARTSKPKDHIDRVKELLDKSYLTNNQELEIAFANQRLGKTILEIHNLTIGYNEKILLDNFSYNFQKMDRIGIIGPNGCGKTSLIKAITNKLTPIKGNIKSGINTNIAYLEQTEPILDEKLSIIEYIKSYADQFKTKDGSIHSAEQLLEKFLFDRKMQQSKISSLSGGEKKRLFLLSSLVFGSNFLILDEPTNDLDIRTLEILEDFLDVYQGCILLISHDRFILDRIVDYLFIFENNKSIKMFPGNYSDYLIVKKFEEENSSKEENDIPKVSKNKSNKDNKKLNFKEQQILSQTEKDIENLENEINNLHNNLNENAHNLDYKEFNKLSEKLNELNNILEKKYEIWTNLSEKTN
ncbi:MAG: ABC-F family ATP-binding cassette domain-containing protein [Candidatus Cloacimonetes bacterium]|jgi:ATP-binding cassette subfamily F protein uup|nr:ABC-F family ATP-binding cassette domain-containing protein [Candidatus Cloacimonadota bacterium]